MSDEALLKLVGKFIKTARQNQQFTQDELSNAAGISRSTLSLLERGGVTNLNTLIKVLRVVKRLDVLQAFNETPMPSPLKLAEEEHGVRYRVRKKKSAQDEDERKTDW